MSKYRNTVTVILWCVLIFPVSLCIILGRGKNYSESERRVLEKFPELSYESLVSAEFMSDFETYLADHMPLRDGFRGVKSFCKLNLFMQTDVNGLYVKDGYIGKTEYPLNEKMLEYASEKFSYLYENYMIDKDMNIYFSIVPDKHYFLSQDKSRISMDYGKLVETMKSQNEYMEYIDIFPLLEIGDYYRTDTHWKQEEIYDVAQLIASKMKAEPLSSDTKNIRNKLDNPFFGVYSGQLALPIKPDTIYFITNDVLDNCIVTSYDTGKAVEKSIYDMEDAYGKDPYEMFLSGSESIIKIMNPHCNSNRRLIIFRDSFASSLAPYLVESYSEITLIDIRYVQSTVLESFVDFENQDVLFLYSTLVLNNSLSLK